ncbi:small integral membrane protein 40 [Ochotona princeps]|uniref:small integral membrane protein 40 n=1 Tax=Ochotona princeps TaxID=9978 RepID=UPI001788A8B7|nr:small integral membrane protein 40 [Ochotona princeps]XP_040838866.1 small integral membrane protein 40 [Ochotona curzoniae]
MAEEEGDMDVDEGDVFLAFARGPTPPRGPIQQVLDKIFFIFLALFLTLLMLEAAYKLLWPLPWAKFGDWLLGTPLKEEELEL